MNKKLIIIIASILGLYRGVKETSRHLKKWSDEK